MIAPSSFTVFARKVKCSGWSKRHIRRKFLKQVEKDDYAKSEVPQLLNWFVRISILGGKKDKSAPGSTQSTKSTEDTV